LKPYELIRIAANIDDVSSGGSSATDESPAT